jgi:hypothetical protein
MGRHVGTGKGRQARRGRHVGTGKGRTGMEGAS